MPVLKLPELLALAIERSLPRHCAVAFCEYLDHGRPLGGFLQAIVANDLYVAAKKSDPMNYQALRQYVDFLYEAADPRAYGSYKRYDVWVKTRAYTVDLTDPQTAQSHDGPEGQDRD